MKIVIIGGVAGGASAAARLRRLDERAEIIVFERSGFVSYANCGLPYYIGGTIEDESDLTLQTPQSFWRRFRIDARVHHEVTAIDRENRTVTVRNLETGAVFAESYDKLVLSPGAVPVRPKLPGIESARIETLRTVEDTLRIRETVVGQKLRSAVVVGGGFIGVEMAENLRELGLDVRLVEMQPQVLGQFDADMASFLHAHLRKHGVELLLGRAVSGFADTETGVRVQFSDSTETEADLVLLAIGVAPDSTLAREAGLSLGARGSIAVNDRMQTSDPDIYAVGDAVEIFHRVTGQRTTVPLAGPANKQGRIAADNICGIPSGFTGSQGSSVMKAFDLTVATTGLTEKASRTAGLDCDAVILTPPSHATYYPGSHPIALKVVFEKPGGRIVGAQAIGREGVDKRIDVLAVAVRARMTARDLTELDLAYAPPYSSAKDPVNMAGYAIENLLDGLVEQVRWSEALDAAGMPRGRVLVDVRTDAEHARGHVEGALHIPLDELRDRLGELPRDATLYVHCQTGLRSYLACRILAQHGFACKNVAGGYSLWEQIELDRQGAEADRQQVAAADRAPLAEGVGPCGLR